MACIVNGALVQLGLDRVDVVFGAPGKQQWGEGDDREDCTTRDDEVDGRHVGWFNSYEESDLGDQKQKVLKETCNCQTPNIPFLCCVNAV